MPKVTPPASNPSRASYGIAMFSDLAVPLAGEALVSRAIGEFGELDVVIHAAGFPVRAQLGTAVRSDFDDAFGAIS